jgi:hypothetical protein
LFGTSEALTGGQLVEAVASFERHSLEADQLTDSAGSDAKGIPTIPPLPGNGARNRTPALTKGGDNADVLSGTFQFLRSSPTGTVSCREPGADCRAGVDRDTGHALIGDSVCRAEGQKGVFVARKARREIAAVSQRSA